MSIETFQKNKCSLESFPNVILLVIQATNTRFFGQNSNFYKSLKAFAELGLVDTKNPNVVVIITFACAIPHKNVSKWKEKMEAKSLEIKGVLLKTLKVNAPVVYIENETEDNELEETEDREQTKLPDGTLQPKNLYLAIVGVMKEANDDLGLMAIKKFFGESLSNKINPIQGLSVPAKNASSESLSSKETMIKNNLIKASMEGSLLPEVDTKINEYLNQNAKKLNEVKILLIVLLLCVGQLLFC